MPAATATVKGGFFAQYASTYTPIQNRAGGLRYAKQYLGDRSLLALRQIARTLNGAVAGSVATKALTRIEANVEMGGKRTVESVNLVNRATTAADVTELNDYLYSMTSKTTMASPVNKDGNPLGTR